MSEKNTFNISAAGKGALLALAVSFLLILAAALACYVFTVSDRALSIVAMAISGVSCFSGAFAAAKLAGQKGLFHGFAVAAFYGAVTTLSGIVSSRGFSFNPHFAAMLTSAFCFGGLGGIFGIR